MYDVMSRPVLTENVDADACPHSVPASRTRIALIGGYSPRRCGIATFTKDIEASLKEASPDLSVDVYAMTPAPGLIAFAPAVCMTITESDPASYAAAALHINSSGADIVWLQHEFGLFGGPAGDMVLELVHQVAAPLIVTLHTVLSEPTIDQMRVMSAIVACASRLVVMSARARQILLSTYGADEGQIVLIKHGVPDRPFGRSELFKSQFGFKGRQVLMTFGLLSPGKGIEAVIAALPVIVTRHPGVLYCIIGATHPNLLAREGEAYREQLVTLAARLGVESHIRWINSFLEIGDLLDRIEAADIYVTPYPGAAQSTSGTLAYAVALGKAVVSTPYVHAAELLADDHGVLVPFNDSAALSREIGALLDQPERLLALQTKAYDRGREMIWPEFAKQCLAMICATKPGRQPVGRRRPKPIGIGGLLRLCDGTGIIQHSIHSVPDRAHGYCVDDNARALLLANRLEPRAEPHRSQLASTFAAFVQSAWNPDAGAFRNFMGFDRGWLETMGSEDSCGRTLWAIGATASEGLTGGLRNWAKGLFGRAAPFAAGYQSPRAVAFAMLGADLFLRCDESNELAGSLLSKGGERLLALFRRASRPDWLWFETVLAYDNCRLSEAMIRAGLRLARADLVSCGLDSLAWLRVQQSAANGVFRPVGSESFGRHFKMARPFDQQPVEAWAAIDAAAAAYDATGDMAWLAFARNAYGWFEGANDRGVVPGDPQSGTCRDGINPRGLNLNEGAESVLSYQLATCAMKLLEDRFG